MSTVADAGPKHGKVWTYIKHRCRCDECRRARREYAESRRPADYGESLNVDLADLLHELFPHGLTDDCPARMRARAS